MFKKTTLLLLFVLATLFALPERGIVVSGQAEFVEQDTRVLKISAADKTILNYSSFNIEAGETVEFVQPSASSCVLNRVTGGHESNILGTLSANGRVFLVNPQGIYFGKEAQVNVGGIVASTLNIKDEDFVENAYHFFLEPGTEQARILNEGVISCSDLGFVALLSPQIQNHGTLCAKAEKIVLASGERIALDVTGDGLIQFSVEGAVKDALIEHYGQIESADGAVILSMPAARAVIKMVVNIDGLTADAIEEEGGVIRLFSTSQMIAQTIIVDGQHVEACGTIDVTNQSGSGGTVKLLGDEVTLWGATIDASGNTGGGEILIGGNYQGHGPERNSQKTIVDETTHITSDATSRGDGGTIIVWSDGQTLFGATASARGGILEGNGGFVETSGMNSLFIAGASRVDTSAPRGEYGHWLLDPTSINVITGGTGLLVDAANCATADIFTIDPTTINGAASNVSLCAKAAAGSSVTITNAISMTNTGVSLSVTAGLSNTGPITIAASITTKGAPITFSGVVTLSADSTLDTTGGGANPAGGSISFSNTVNGGKILSLNAGTGGSVTFSNAVGGGTALTSLTVTNALSLSQNSTVRATGAVNYTAGAITIANNITTITSGAISITGPVTITGPITLTTAGTQNISFSSTVNGGTTLSLSAAGATVSFGGAVGASTPLTSLTVSAGTITQNSSVKTVNSISYTASTVSNVGGDLTTTYDGGISFTGPVNLSGPATIRNTVTLSFYDITFSSTVNGAQALSVIAQGRVFFSGAIGGITPLASLSATSDTEILSGIVRTSGAVSFTAPSILLGGNITTLTSGSITMNGYTNFGGSLTKAMSTAGNQDIFFSTTIMGNGVDFTLSAGTGTITFSDVAGISYPFRSLTVSSAGLLVQNSTAQATGAISYTATAIKIANNITTTTSGAITMNGAVTLSGSAVLSTAGNKNISFSNTVNGGKALTLSVGTGTVTFSNAVGGTTPLTSLTVSSAASIAQNSTVQTTGAVSYTATAINIGNSITTTTSGSITMAGAVTLSGPAVFTTAGNQNISFSNTVNGGQALTLSAGTGTVTFSNAVGGTTPLTSLTVSSASSIAQNSTVKTTGAVSYTATAINIGNNITTTTSGAITMAGAVTLSGPATFTTAGNQDISFSTTLNGAQSLALSAAGGTVVFSGAVGGSTPLTSLTVSSSANVTQSSTVQITGDTSYTGSTLIGIGGNITTTTSGAITMNGPASINSNATLDSSAGNKTIWFTSSLTVDTDDTRTLILKAGGGAINLDGSVGDATHRLASLAFTSGSVTASNPIHVMALSQDSGSALFNGTITTYGASGIDLTGAAFTFNGLVNTTSGSGPISITNSGTVTVGAAITSGSFFKQLGGGGSNTLSANISTNGDLQFSSAITLGGDAILDASLGAGAILLSSTVNGAHALTLTSGGGSATVSDAIGASTPLSAFTASGNTVTLANIGNAGTLAAGVSGTTSVTASPSSITFTGASYYANTQTYSSPSNFFLNAGAPTSFTTNGNPISFSNAGVIQLSAGTDLTITTSNGALSTDSIDAATGDLRTLTLNGGTGTVSVGAIGTASIDEFLSVVITSGTLNLTGNIVTQAITLPAAAAYTIYLGGSITTANNPIAFHRAVTINTAPTVTLTAGNGAISFDNTLDGDISHTPSLTLETTGAVTFSTNVGANFPLGDMLFSSVGDITASGSISATSITETAGTGTASFNGIMTTGVSGINLVGSIYTFNGAVNTATGAGPVTITNSGALTINPGAAFMVGGSFTQNGSSTSNSVADNITTNNGPLSFLRTVTIAGTPTFDSGNANQDITFFSSLTVDADTTRTLTLNAGLGAISCLGTIGDATHRLGTLAISSGALSASAAVHAMALTQAAGSAQFDSTLTTYAPGTNLSVTGSTYTFSDVVDTGPGAVQITNSGTNSINAPFIVGTSFTQNGVGANSVGANITTTNGSISFLRAITLTANTITMDSSGGSGTIGLASTIDSDFVTPRSLTLTADSGAITLGGVLGAIRPLNVLTIASAGGVTANGAISAASITQTTGTGISAFNGALTTTDGSGITLIGPACTFSGIVNTLTGSGPVTITNNAGLCTINAPFTVGGTFIQNGTGFNAIGADITTTSGAIAFSTTIQLTNSVTMDTTNGNASSGANILFSDSIEDNAFESHSLSLRAGAGDISFSSAVGGVVPLGDIIISSANNVSAPPTLENSAFLLTGGTGTATLYDMGTNSDWLNTVDVSSNHIVFCGVIYATQSNFIATGSIQNCNNSAEVHTIQPVTFNAFGGNVGSEAIPINIDAANQVTVGSTYLAELNGTTGDGTIHNDLVNPPCVVIFNGVTIYNCHPTPPPPPPQPLSPPTPSSPISNKVVFPAPGFDSSFFNLASDFYFCTIFLGKNPYEMGPNRIYCFVAK